MLQNRLKLKGKIQILSWVSYIDSMPEKKNSVLSSNSPCYMTRYGYPQGMRKIIIKLMEKNCFFPSSVQNSQYFTVKCTEYHTIMTLVRCQECLWSTTFLLCQNGGKSLSQQMTTRNIIFCKWQSSCTYEFKMYSMYKDYARAIYIKSQHGQGSWAHTAAPR